MNNNISEGINLILKGLLKVGIEGISDEKRSAMLGVVLSTCDNLKESWDDLDSAVVFKGLDSNDTAGLLMGFLSSMVLLLTDSKGVEGLAQSMVSGVVNLVKKEPDDQSFPGESRMFRQEEMLASTLAKFSQSLTNANAMSDDTHYKGCLIEAATCILEAMDAISCKKFYTMETFEALDPELRFMAIQSIISETKRILQND